MIDTNGPTTVVVGFQARIKIDSQIHRKGTFGGLPILYAVC